MTPTFRLAVRAVMAAALAAPPLVAQRAAPTTYAITNAKIVPVAGPTIEKGTVVVRDGLVTAVGATVAVPGDARVVDGAGLTVYPGLIDAYGSLGQASATPAAGGGRAGGGGAAQAQLAAAAALLNRPAGSAEKPAGFSPELKVVDQLHPDAEALAGPQFAGITAALSAPTTGVMQGQSVFINLAGGDAQAMVIKGSVAQHVGFTPSRGGYPNSLMGVFAALRQTLLDAQHYRDEQAAYARNPRGMRRPEFDAGLEALQPVLARQQPVVMLANQQREIERALDLGKEFGLKVVIAGGSEAWKVADRLKAENVPVLLSLNFPRRVAAPAPDADPEPVRVLRERVEVPKGAGRLASAGVRFAFESGGLAAWTDFLPNVRMAVENGLSADEAVRALTVRGAEIFGLADRLGTIEPGKIANLTLVRGDLLDRNARVTQLFIDGAPVTVRPPTVANAAGGGNAGGGNFGGGAQAGASGTWTVTVLVEGEEKPVTFLLRQEGTRLTGTMQGVLGTNEIANGSATPDGQVQFTAGITLKSGTEEATFAGTVEGNAMRGKVGIVGHEPGLFAGTRPAGGGQGGRPRPPGQ
ncbi:MAG: amidohydrolase family protein [Gemmatimonadetes bacterium]|nr:amidohydrolase family protein [Gemmatimonadota bacterium]